MTVAEARRHFGLRDTDVITINGIQSILNSVEKQLNVWSITNAMREDLEIEKEACIALLEEAK